MPNRIPKKRYSKYGRKKPMNKAAVARIANKVYNKKAEIKFHDADDVGSGIDSSGSVFDISLISQGDTDQTRDGDKIYVKSIIGRMTLTAGDATNFLRVIIVQWLAENSGITITKVIQSLTGAINQSYAHDYASARKILYDKTFTLGSANTASVPTVRTAKFMITRGFKRTINFLGGSTDGYNKLYMVCVSDSGGVPNPTLAYSVRVRYTDS